MKSLDKKNISELFEGEGSTLHQSFVRVVERDKETKELDWHLEWDYLLNKKKWKNPDEVNKVLTKFVEDLLQNQRKKLWAKEFETRGKLVEGTRMKLLEEIKKEIDYSESHHEVVLENWEEESRDVFKSKSEVKGFLMALEAFRELITNLLNKKDE